MAEEDLEKEMRVQQLQGGVLRSEAQAGDDSLHRRQVAPILFQRVFENLELSNRDRCALLYIVRGDRRIADRSIAAAAPRFDRNHHPLRQS